MDNFKVIIAGSRGFSNYKLLRESCNKYLREKRKTCNIIVISGGARGADALGEKYAQDEGFDLEIYKADWKKLGKSASFRRMVSSGNRQKNIFHKNTNVQNVQIE